VQEEKMMNNQLLALKLMLDELEVDRSIGSLNDRKRLQKAVYLGQLAGLDLGYRYGWYLRGPYSTTLTQAYYDLERNVAVGSDESVRLNPEVSQKLQRLRPLFKQPSGFDRSQEDWLELLASYHFLRREQQATHTSAVSTLREKKPHVAGFVDLAKKALEQYSLL
jgi:hypothetical protein